MVSNPQKGMLYRAINKTVPLSESFREFLGGNDECDIVKINTVRGDGVLECGGKNKPDNEWFFNNADLEPLSENETMRVRYEWGLK